MAGRIIRQPELMGACGHATAHWERWMALSSRTPIFALGAPGEVAAVPAVADRVAAFLETDLD